MARWVGSLATPRRKVDPMTRPDPGFWRDVLAHLRRHHPDVCRQWFDDITPLGFDGVVLIARIDNDIRRGYLERHCAACFTDALQARTGRLVSIRFVGAAENHPARPQAQHAPARQGPGAATPPPGNPPFVIDPDFAFEHFIVSPENRIAHAASMAVAANPGTAYNPLFIHGGVGLGKTHLLHAISLRLLSATPALALHYLPCDEFSSQFMDAVQAGHMTAFSHRFRDLDVLLIDDIHFLAGRDRTQEEFFHTFNALLRGGRQIVLSSDAPPDEIPDLEARLVSRFQSGLVVEVAFPSYETRVRIVKQKARMRGIDLPDEVAAHIASKATSNIRQLEGALTRVQVQHIADYQPISLALARAALDAPAQAARADITLEGIIDVVVGYYGVRLSDLQSPRRQKSIVRPRQVCMYFARRHTRFSLQEIGERFGRRDHTTVMHAIRTIERRRDTDLAFGRVLQALEEQLHAPAHQATV